MHAAARPHVAAAEAYARDVVAGRIPACRLTVLACERHLKDLERAKDPEFPYRFDPDHGERVCVFAELLPHTKGKWAIARAGDRSSNRLRLEPWQSFILASLFGWRNKRTGLRRYRRAYVEVPRKNGKSALASVVGLYMLAADGEFGAEVYAGATTLTQALEVYRPAKQIVERTPELREAFGIAVGEGKLATIHIPANGSRFEPVIGRPGDGASPSCAIVDEYHEHDTDDLYETMASGMGAREQPLIFVITTAGYNIGGPCYQMRIDVAKVLRGEDQNDELFAIVYSIDDGDDWTSDLALRKANPNFGVSVGEDYLRSEQRQAVLSSRRQNTFKTKHLNIWVSSRSGFFNMEAWRRCEDPALSLEQFKRERCWIGLDLASKRDISAAVLLFRRMIDDQPHFYVFGRYYLPEAAIHEGPNARKYEDWENTGKLISTGGNVTDYDRIEDDLRDDARTFEVAEVAFDKFQATQLVGHLLDEGFPMIEVGATVLNFSEPMKELEGLILDGRLHHDGNPALTWMMSNVVAKYDAKDNVFPRKERDEFKIDGPVALLMALNRAMAGAGDQAETGCFAE